jgi:hypothetical protein
VTGTCALLSAGGASLGTTLYFGAGFIVGVVLSNVAAGVVRLLLLLGGGAALGTTLYFGADSVVPWT